MRQQVPNDDAIFCKILSLRRDRNFTSVGFSVMLENIRSKSRATFDGGVEATNASMRVSIPGMGHACNPGMEGILVCFCNEKSQRTAVRIKEI